MSRLTTTELAAPACGPAAGDRRGNDRLALPKARSRTSRFLMMAGEDEAVSMGEFSNK
jgi:hypothetical protein